MRSRICSRRQALGRQHAQLTIDPAELALYVLRPVLLERRGAKHDRDRGRVRLQLEDGPGNAGNVDVQVDQAIVRAEGHASHPASVDARNQERPVLIKGLAVANVEARRRCAVRNDQVRRFAAAQYELDQRALVSKRQTAFVLKRQTAFAI